MTVLEKNRETLLQDSCAERKKRTAKPSHYRGVAGGRVVPYREGEETVVLCAVVGDLPVEKYELVLSQLQPCGTQTDHNTDFYCMQMFRLDIKNQVSFVNIDSTKCVIKEDRSVCLFFRMMDCSPTFCMHA